MFKIITDNGSDLSRVFLEEYDVGCMYLSTILDGEIISGAEKELAAADFYRMLSEGAKPTTSQINPDEAERYFKAHIDEADEFLYISLSSGLSGTLQSVSIAANKVMEEYPNKCIEVVDSLTGSPAQGLLVYYAVTMRDAGKSLAETAEWLRNHAKNSLLVLSVDNLFDLWRGGRVSRSSAVLGSLVGIKPVLVVDDQGKLQVTNKIRGRKKSLNYLVDYMEEKMGSFREQNRHMVIINHGNVPEDAAYTAELIRKRFGFDNILIGNVGPMIGTHTGSSIVVVSFLGENRMG